jgi:NAD(P)-dependent dehydrogenase (short-subunit alcohol dehydrogenase family)
MTVELIRADGGAAQYVHHDVTSEADWATAVEEVRRRFGGLDILVNNAGVGDLGSIEDTDLARYEHTIAVTQTSVFLGLRAAGELLKRSGRGSVVNISSVFGASGGFGTSPAYHAAKGAVRLLTKNAALAWAQKQRARQLGPSGLHRYARRARARRHDSRGSDDRHDADGPARPAR